MKIEVNNILEKYEFNNIEEINSFNWERISYFEDLSEDFIIEFKDKLDLKMLLERNKISRKFYNDLKYKKPKTRFQLLDFE